MKKKLIWVMVMVMTVPGIFYKGVVAQQKKSDTLQIKTSAVCGMCKERIEEGLAFEKGIREAILDIDTKMLTVVFNPVKTTPKTIRKRISDLGYDADSIPADTEAYKKLPACCKKDAPPHDRTGK